MTKDNLIVKLAKIILVICLIIFLFKEKSLEALNIIRDFALHNVVTTLIINNIFIVIIIVIIILIWRTNQGGN